MSGAPDGAPDGGPPDAAALVAENAVLRARVRMLEVALEERRQLMDQLFTSRYWKVTAPVRVASARYRRALAAVRRARARRAPVPPALAAPTTGLFAPAVPPGGAGPAAGADPAALRVAPRTLGRRPGGPAVLVVAHVYYPELWPDIADRLARMPERFDLAVSLVEGPAADLADEIRAKFPGAAVSVVPNSGRDMRPLVDLANAGAFVGYDAVCKVHTKRSPHRVDGHAWRQALLDGVLESPRAVADVLALLREDTSAGLVVPSGHVAGPEHWGSNEEAVTALAARLPLAFDPASLRFAAGSMFWARPWTLQRLADLCIGADDFGLEAGHIDGTLAHAVERVVGLLCTRGGLDVVETAEVPGRLRAARRRRPGRPRVLAFYLPQFHRTPENDAWWGEGFTDWVNAARARPLFAGHRQPEEPGELGAYDLADPAVLHAQAALARAHGVDGLVLHHYWFDGAALLRRPLENLLADPTVDLPFALCWANESWTRRWDGLDSDVLVAQTYPPGWADAFFADVLPALRDPRYLRVDGRPLLVVYRVGQVPVPELALARWRQLAVEAGLPGLHLLAVVPGRDFEGLPPGALGAVDGLVRFPPGSGIGLQSVRGTAPGLVGGTSGDVYSYDAAFDVPAPDAPPPPGVPLHPGVMPGWDNTARRGRAAYVFHGSNPVSFRRWLAGVVAASPSLVFVNAWNEWAEGAHLEPDARFGRGWLESVADVVGVRPQPQPAPGGGRCATGGPEDGGPEDGGPGAGASRSRPWTSPPGSSAG